MVLKEIRVSEIWQQAAVHYLRIHAFVKGQNIPLEMEFDDGDGSQASYVLLLDGSEPEATARLHLLEAQTAKIERVCVAAEYRGRGVGRQLIEATERWAKESGTRKIVITSQTQAVGFYESLGYRQNPDIHVDSKIPCVYTEKTLEESAICSVTFKSPAEKAARSTTFGKIATSESVKEISREGAFVRQKNRFVTPFGSGEGELPVEANRYRLLWAPICPWAHRSIIVRKILGLEDVISVGTANPVRTEKGWEFSLDPDGVDPVLGIRYLPEIYAKTDPEYTGRATVPTVVDVKLGKVVNNDYFHLTNYLETSWKSFHKAGAPDLYPEHLRKDIDALNDVLFNDVNNGVYKAGFAQSQEAYEKAYDTLFARLDELEKRLSKSRYLFGDRITDSDVRLYVTLARFDAAYYPVFRTNRNRIVDFPNLWGYARDLYQSPGFGETTNFDAIKKGYHSIQENTYRIIPKGPELGIWLEPHHRNEL